MPNNYEDIGRALERKDGPLRTEIEIARILLESIENELNAMTPGETQDILTELKVFNMKTAAIRDAKRNKGNLDLGEGI